MLNLFGMRSGKQHILVFMCNLALSEPQTRREVTDHPAKLYFHIRQNLILVRQVSFLPPLFSHGFRNSDSVVMGRFSDLSRTCFLSKSEDINAEICGCVVFF